MTINAGVAAISATYGPMCQTPSKRRTDGRTDGQTRMSLRWSLTLWEDEHPAYNHVFTMPPLANLCTCMMLKTYCNSVVHALQ